MGSFPKLKTTAVAQYPAAKTLRFQNQAVRFVDGAEQRYRDSAGALHRWKISLSELDEGEIAAVEEFFAANQGSFGSFTFNDPWDGQAYANCSLESDQLNTRAVAAMRGTTVLTIVENRG